MATFTKVLLLQAGEMRVKKSISIIGLTLRRKKVVELEEKEE